MGRAKSAFGKTVSPKTIFDLFPREQITETSDFPTRVFGHITTAESICTGTLIGPKHILTAAHCVYDKIKSTWQEEVKFVPGRSDSDTIPYGEIKATKFFIHQNYLTTPDGYDYAVIELETAIGDDIGWAGFEIPDHEVTKFNAQITGYPGDKDFGTMWNVECPAEMYQEDQILHLCDTFGGMSGSTIRSKSNNEYAIGIHTSGSENFNIGLLINEERFDFILSWVNNENIKEETVTHDNYFPPTQTFERIHFRNDCSSRVAIIVHYKNLNGDWLSDGPWRLEEGEEGYLFDTRNTIFYYYAVSTDGDRWMGNNNIYFDDVLLPMKKHTSDFSDWGDYTLNLSCN